MVLHLKNSRIEFALALLIFLAAFYSLTLIDLPKLSLLALGIFVAALCIDYLTNYFQTKLRVQRISYNGNSWQLFIEDKAIETAAPRMRFFSEFLITVDFPAENHGNFRLMFFPDSLCKPEWLQFRRFLRFENLPVN